MWDVDGLLDGLDAGSIAEWMAFYAISRSDEDPEPTKWDTKETAAEKLRQKALRGTG